MKKIKKYWNKSVAIVASIMLVFVSLENTLLFRCVQAEENILDTSAIFYVSKSVMENGKKINGVSNMLENSLKDGILYQFADETAVSFSTKSEGEKFESSSKIYSDRDYQMISKENDFSGVLVAEREISVSGQDNKICDGILFSKNGNITLSGKNVEVTGILYAPKGEIKFQCENLKINGCIIAENVIIHSASAEYVSNSAYINQVYLFQEYRNRESFNINMYYHEEKRKIGIEDIKAQTIKMYLRYDNENFSLVDDYENGELFGLPKEDGYIEAYAEIVDQFGEKKVSNIETFYCEGEDYYSKVVHDTDGDGIPDGYEIRDELGDWHNADTDGDGIQDGEEKLVYDSNGEKLIDFQMEKDHWEALREKCGNILRVEQMDNDRSIVSGTYIRRAGDDLREYYNADNEKVTEVYNIILGVKRVEMVGDKYTLYFYDTTGQLDAKLAYDGVNYLYNEYNYGKQGIQTILHNNMEYGFRYDSKGRVKDIKINNSAIQTIVWENNKKCIKTFANDYKFVMEYDEIGNLTKLSNSEGILYQWIYDKEQHYQLKEAIDYTNSTTYMYEYDDNGEIKELTSSNGYQYSVQTDGLNRVNESRYGDLLVTELFQLDGGIYTYQCGGLKEKIEDGNKSVYVDNSKIYTEKTIQNNDEGKIVTHGEKTFRYEYDSENLLKEVWENNVCIASYEYNNLKEMIRENCKAAKKTYLYEYDAGGNIQKIWSYPLNFSLETEKLKGGFLEAEYEYNKEFTDQLVSYKNEKITYDALGNPINYWNGSKFKWTQAQKLGTVRNEEGITEYSYNMDGERCQKKQGDCITEYFYQDGNLILESDREKTIWYRYDALGNLVGFEYNGQLYLYELNQNQDVIGIMDVTGKRLVQYQYDSWGKVLAIIGDKQLGVKNPFRYHSYYYDNETGFYYLHNRYYDPDLKRMLNMDSYTDTGFGMFSHNLYAYCENTPVNACNYSGNIPNWVDKNLYTSQDYLWEAKKNDYKYNCYGYAINMKEYRNPGYFSNAKLPESFTLENIVNNTVKDLKKLGHKPQKISKADIKDFKKTYKIIAVRTGGRIGYSRDIDYHYMKLVEKKYWCHKPGGTAKLYHKFKAWELASWQPRAYSKNTWLDAQYSYSSSTAYIAYLC